MNPTRTVTSFNLATWVIANGHTPTQVLPGHTVTLVFDDSGGAVSALIERWRHDSVNVNASVFLAAQNQVRNIIKSHQTTRNQTATPATDNRP
jgi:hypothetical protein